MRGNYKGSVRLPISLSPTEVSDVVNFRLQEIIGDYFIRDGWVYEVHDYGRGSPYDEKIARDSDPRFKAIVAAIAFREVLKELK